MRKNQILWIGLIVGLLVSCKSKQSETLFEEVKTNLLQRDYDDTHRKESPLIKAKDAIVLDNTDLSKEEQLEYVLKLINELYLTRD